MMKLELRTTIFLFAAGVVLITGCNNSQKQSLNLAGVWRELLSPFPFPLPIKLLQILHHKIMSLLG